MPGGVHENMKSWQPEEDRRIIELLSEFGPRWSVIVDHLPGRTISSVRNRWLRIDKGRRMQEAGIEAKKKCKRCNLPKAGHVCFERMAEIAVDTKSHDTPMLLNLADVVANIFDGDSPLTEAA